MTVETCHRCRTVTDTDEDHRCPHGEYCQMLDGNTGDCRSYCHVCDDELRDAEAHALMVERDALKAEVKRLRSSSALDKQLAVKEGEARMTRTAVELVNASEDWVTAKDPDAHMIRMRDEARALDSEVAALRARVAELEAPRSPNALELAEAWDAARSECYARCHDSQEGSERLESARKKFNAARAALVAYDDRRPK